MGWFSAYKVAIWLFLLKMAAVAIQVLAQSSLPSQEGFVSIACGVNSSYVDSETQITYVSDDQYIDTGSISKIDPFYASYAVNAQYLYLRSFPTGERNCYTFLPVVRNKKYLVRALFMYGNYDGKNSANLRFDLHLGVNLWDTVIFSGSKEYHYYDAVMLAAANFTSICLINTGNGVPFISAIELRPLEDSMYNMSKSDLNYIVRYSFGAERSIRYQFDPYDRTWDPQDPETVTTTFTIQNSSSHVISTDAFDVPSVVLQRAITPFEGKILTFKINPRSRDGQIYYVLHFAELQDPRTKNFSRIFDVYMNGKKKFNNFSPRYLSSADIVLSGGGSQNTFSLEATKDSTLPPIINAFEVHSVIPATLVPTDLNDVYAIDSIRKQYLVKRNWMGDPCSPSKYIWDGLQCRYDRNSTRITSLNLSSSGLTGVISSSFAGLTELTYLDLSNNNLTGAIPDALGNILSLKLLILSCNNLTGPIPASLQHVVVRYDTHANACEMFLKRSSKGMISKPIIVVLSVVPAILLLTVVFIVWRTRKVPALGSNSSMPPNYHPMSPFRKQKSDHVDHQIQGQMKQFTYKELLYLTRNFENVIGGGGFGVVYRGSLQDGKEVAVKMLSDTSRQGTKEFLAEAQNLTRIHHRNLVSLVGYCMEGNYLGLVYEYMAQGSLRDHLKENTVYRTLRWVDRLRIAIESAKGLEYLHKGCSPPIIHRDVKSVNILLNKDMEAKLSDFGLSRVFHNDHQTHVSTKGVAGTPGYLDPEYQNSLLLNEKSDVYSFGVVLMELITGRSPIIQVPEYIHIAQWVAQNIERGDIEEIVDKRLLGEYDVDSVRKIVDLSMKCTAPRGSQRPSMSEVVTQLKETLDLALVTITSEKSENYDTFTSIIQQGR